MGYCETPLSVCVCVCFFFFFFFKQKTAYEIVDCDWSSDVCSSDLIEFGGVQAPCRGDDPQLRRVVTIVLF